MFRQPIRPTREQRIAERAARNAAQAQTCMPRRAAVMGGGTAGPVVKSSPWRCQAILDMAHGRRCLLRFVEGCHGVDGSTTVACHENQGKGMGTKVSDHRTVWGCHACHAAYDQGPAPRENKRAAFEAGYRWQLLEWRRIAADPSEPPRYRRAAALACMRDATTNEHSRGNVSP